MEKLDAKGEVRDIKFRNYVAKMIRNGDKTRLQNLLNLSYPTLMLHLGGVYSSPAIQSQIIDYFEKRAAANRRAVNYIDKRLKMIDDNILTVDDIPQKDEEKPQDSLPF